jgi:MSHA pilin protein MshA
MNSKVNQRGFTLIELVVVITILGILAAFAIPRFTRMEGQARAATVEALAGSLRSSSALAHAMWLASGQLATVTLEGGVVITMANGYPNRATIDDTLSDLTGFTYTANNGVFQRNGAPNTCRVTYNQAPAGGAPTLMFGSTPLVC